jgi:hypothetical protein
VSELKSAVDQVRLEIFRLSVLETDAEVGLKYIFTFVDLRFAEFLDVKERAVSNCYSTGCLLQHGGPGDWLLRSSAAQRFRE